MVLSLPGRWDDAGCVTATQVADVDEAQRAVDAGVDVLVARGAEAGGHGRPTVGTLPLLVEVLDRVTVPVLAAGGIASGRRLAVALAAGASAGWLGTAFATCPESTLPDAAARVMLAACDTDTVTTRVFDIALGYPWPPDIPERVVRNAFTDSWHGRESELAANAETDTVLRAAIAAHDYRLAPVNAGQGVSEVTAIEPAARVIQRLCDGAREVLQQ